MEQDELSCALAANLKSSHSTPVWRPWKFLGNRHAESAKTESKFFPRTLRANAHRIFLSTVEPDMYMSPKTTPRQPGVFPPPLVFSTKHRDQSHTVINV